MAAAVARDVIIVLGALLLPILSSARSTARPSIVSKLNTLCQAAFILAVVGRAEFSRAAGMG